MEFIAQKGIFAGQQCIRNVAQLRSLVTEPGLISVYKSEVRFYRYDEIKEEWLKLLVRSNDYTREILIIYFIDNTVIYLKLEW